MDHQWQEYAGGHDAAYWTAHTPDYLRFYAAAFAAAASEDLRLAHER